MHKHPEQYQIRKANPGDLDAILNVFRESIQVSCAEDYSEQQINAWLNSIEDQEKWKGRIKDDHFIVCLSDTKIIGFASLIRPDYIDLLYVLNEYQNMGIASRMLEVLENESKSESIRTHASLTAKSFFEKRCYKISKKNHVKIDQQSLVNFLMIKNI